MRHIFSIIILLNIASITLAQSVTDINAVLESEKVIVSYNLNGNPGESFDVKLFYSLDEGQNWQGPLKQVSGAAGNNQIPGNNKIILWNHQSEGVALKGALQFKIETQNLNTSANTVLSSNSIQIDNNVIESKPWVFDSEYRKHNVRRYVWLGLGATSIIMSIPHDGRSKQYIYWGVGALGITGFFIQNSMANRVKRKYQVTAMNYRDGFGIGVTYNF